MSGTATAAKVAMVAAKEARKLLSRTMHAEEWRLCGNIEVGEAVGAGRWMVSTPAEDPLRLEHTPTGRALCVPFSRMETDFASVPKAVQGVGGKTLHLDPRAYERTAFFHDQLYSSAWAWAVKRGENGALAVRVPVSKREADAVLFVCLECEGATVADGLAYHAAVALFGGDAWKKCRRENEEWPLLFGEEGA